MLDVYPPWGEPMRDTDSNLLALFYRSVYTVIGDAPRSLLGCIGTVLSSLGAYAAITGFQSRWS